MVINKIDEQKRNKFILELTLEGQNKSLYGSALEIKIIYWNRKFLWNDNDEFTQMYYEDDDGFRLYSFDEGEIYPNTFVLPEKGCLKPDHKITYRFPTEKDRYNYLKKLYNCLESWSKKWAGFVEDNTISIKDINMHDKFWTL